MERLRDTVETARALTERFKEAALRLRQMEVVGSPLYAEKRESVRLTGREPKETVVVYHTPGEGSAGTEKAGVIVLQYDAQEGLWKEIFEEQVTNLPLRVLAVGPFLGGEQEQVLIGAIQDSGHRLHFLVLGSREGKPAILLNRIDDPVPLHVKQ